MSIKNSIFSILSILFLISCGSSKRTAAVKEQQQNYTELYSEAKAANPIMLQVSENALEFLGTRYKYGGTTKRGMDCSGLIYTAFLEEEIALPRTSRGMSLHGNRIDLEEAEIGDLLFFETNKNRKVINHVGLVVKTTPQELFFIHSTTSRGVMISSLNQNYWNASFVMARRMQ